MSIKYSTISVFLYFSLLLTTVQSQKNQEDYDLVLLVVVDMLKGEVPFQHEARLSGGIRYLMEKGTHYSNAHYQHATTFTAVGHAVIATGAPASEHGLAGNDWADRHSGVQIYCVSDPDSEPLADTWSPGTSPKNLTATTFSDEIILSSGGKSRAFGVSIKDRGAILPVGRLGTAYWYNPGNGDFITSTYYKDELPVWVDEFNQSGAKDIYRDQKWTLLKPWETYTFSHRDDRPFEKGYYELGPVLPKRLNNNQDAAYYGGLRFSPAGDELTLEFAKRLMEAEAIGRRGDIDILSVSLSALDYVGHAWGTHSLEYEDHFLQVDKMLGDFFEYVDRHVGLDRTLIILTSDHGSDDIAEFQQKLGLDTGRHHPETFLQHANRKMSEITGIEDDIIMAFWNPSLYLDLEKLSAHGISIYDAERYLKNIMLEIVGIAYAETRTDLMQGNLPDTKIINKLQRSFHPTRSGNVLIIQDQFWYLYPDANQFAAMHGSPYAYDTHVPVIAAGPGISEGKVVHRKIAVDDIAPTITQLLRARRPSGADGYLLHELLSNSR